MMLERSADGVTDGATGSMKRGVWGTPKQEES
jgi:hypothetical protein